MPFLVTYVRNNQIFFNVEQVIHIDATQVGKLFARRIQELSNAIPFFTLKKKLYEHLVHIVSMNDK